MTPTIEELKALFNAQTGKMRWPELMRYFARGVVFRVSPDLDLIDVAVAINQDDKQQIEVWTSAGQLSRADDQDAMRWQECNQEFWAVVVAPWVLVQECTE
jgi:hypothetical protein